ncbi:unnamed protein product [Staurois parvus]|uniref:Uncharacterized protein n=1 Tax=Staurois parvus TaxID=386267 RepID=A0ABN9CJS9_9NEOB|nr:unnamed protein product [Staurois parvus]
MCIARENFLFLRESACDQQRTNQRCPDRGSGVLRPPRAERKLLSFNQCSTEH